MFQKVARGAHTGLAVSSGGPHAVSDHSCISEDEESFIGQACFYTEKFDLCFQPVDAHTHTHTWRSRQPQQQCLSSPFFGGKGGDDALLKDNLGNDFIDSYWSGASNQWRFCYTIKVVLSLSVKKRIWVYMLPHIIIHT